MLWVSYPTIIYVENTGHLNVGDGIGEDAHMEYEANGRLTISAFMGHMFGLWTSWASYPTIIYVANTWCLNAGSE